MKYFRILIFFPLLVSGLISCSEKNGLESIGKLEQKLRSANYNSATDSNAVREVKPVAEKLMHVYQEFVKENPESPLSGDYLCRAGGIAESYHKDLSEAIKIYETVFRDYPGTQAEMMALARLGAIYRYKLRQPAKALEYYQTFVDKYPFTSQSMEIKQIIDSIKTEKTGK